MQRIQPNASVQSAPAGSASASVQPKPAVRKAVEKGDIVSFGTYPQALNDSRQPIRWMVLEVANNKALLLSKVGL